MLQGLAARGFLDQLGQKRGCSYRLPAWASSFASGGTALAPGATALAPGATALRPELRPLRPEHDPRLLAIAKPAREKEKTDPLSDSKHHSEPVPWALPNCRPGRSVDGARQDKLQKNFLADMVQNQELELRYPEQPTHPEQAYRTNPDWKES